MRDFTRFFSYAAIAKAVMVLLLLCGWARNSTAQQAARPDPTPDPELLCSPTYRQQAGATYVAAYHLTGSFSAFDIGTTGVNTIINAGLYGGTVVFNGIYHVRGNVLFANGTVDLRPGTVFYVEGLSGQQVPFTPPSAGPGSAGMESSTFIEVSNASLELTGATILSTCPRAWGGINLLDHGRIRTRVNPAASAPAGRCAIRDAYIAVDVMPTVSGRSTGEYYLNGTDFLNNYVGV